MDLFEHLMPTYGNGDLLGRNIYSGINQNYTQQCDNYFSYQKLCYNLANHACCANRDNRDNSGKLAEHTLLHCPSYPSNPDEFLPVQLPTSSKIRDIFKALQYSNHTMSGICDRKRLTREIQAVITTMAVAQDHTADAAKN